MKNLAVCYLMAINNDFCCDLKYKVVIIVFFDNTPFRPLFTHLMGLKALLIGAIKLEGVRSSNLRFIGRIVISWP